MKNNSQEYNDFKELIDESKADLSNYIEKRLTLAKLKVYEKVASSFSYIIYSLMVVAFVLILFFLALIGLGLFLGEVLNNYSLGFGILILFILIVFVIIMMNSRRVRKSFVNITLRTIKKIEEDEE